MTATVLIYAISILLAGLAGGAGAYFFYRARHREALAEMESLDQELTQREADLRRMKYQVSTSRVHADPDSASYDDLKERIEVLRDELEQRELDLNILRQDYDLETRILRQELDQFHANQKDATRDLREQLEAERARLAEERRAFEQQRASKGQDARHVLEQVEVEQARLAEARRALEADQARLLEERGRLKEQHARIAEAQDRLEAEGPELAAAARDLEQQRQKLALQADALTAREHQLAEREAAHAERASHEERPPEPPASGDAGDALLIKRLRQQIRLQEEELAQLRTQHTRPLRLRPQQSAEDEASEAAEGPAAVEAPGTFPTFSPLSSFVGQRTTPAAQGDALTVLPGVDAAVEAQLHALGIHRLDQVARWSSADVRRIAEQLGLDRRLIQERWIVEAQSHLYEQQAQ